jgi:hypothetical protein
VQSLNFGYTGLEVLGSSKGVAAVVAAAPTTAVADRSQREASSTKTSRAIRANRRKAKRAAKERGRRARANR